MLRIRRVYDEILPIDREALRQAREILRSQFDGLSEEDVESFASDLRDPFKRRFRPLLYVAEDGRRRVRGFALLLHEPKLRFGFLEYIATPRGRTGSGIGGVLYERVREEGAAQGMRGIFYECLPADPDAYPPEVVAQNAARLRFYERYGARPIADTAYETPVDPADKGAPHLVFDGLEHADPPGQAFVRAAVRAILERKYAELCPPSYVRRVVESIADDPVRLRARRHTRPPAARGAARPAAEPIPLVVNDRHDIHHVRERGYVEAPARISSILKEIEPTGMFARLEPREHGERVVKEVHDPRLVDYLRRACREVPEGKSLYPYVFPIRNADRLPRERSVLAGYFCIDTFTPIHRNAYLAARRGVDCTLTAADEILAGCRLAYALVRPPGHHAERRSFGGFCYFNNAGVAAHYLSRHGKVAILDVDYHHGNGQQDVFYGRADVLTVSIHGHPSFAYPYFTGFEEERGEGDGEGFNLNMPLPEARDGRQYLKALDAALRAVDRFDPTFVVVALGLDGAKGDPTGTWTLTAADFAANGERIGELGRPLLVVQEGGYRTRSLGVNARHFFTGLATGVARR
jgi:acetoin utilization deacetylase AcuC-like enzyme